MYNQFPDPNGSSPTGAEKNFLADESQKRCSHLLKDMPHGFALCEIIHDAAGAPCDYRYVEVNNAFARLCNTTSNKLNGKSARELDPVSPLLWLERLGSVAETGSPVLFEHYFPRIKTWHEIHVYRPQTNHVAFLLHDVTDRKRTEDALRESQEQYRSLAEAGMGLVWTWHHSGKADFINACLRQYTGLNLEELNEHGWTSFIHPDDDGMMKNLLSQATEKGKAFEAEFRYRRVDGEYRWFWGTAVPVQDARGQIFKWVCVAMDITERKQSEEALYRNEELMREYVKLLEYAPVMVRTMDDEILLWNRGMEKIYGYSPADAVSKRSNVLLKTRYPEPLEDILSTLQATGRWEGDLKHIASDGREIIVNSLWILHKNSESRPTVIIQVNTDITLRKRAEEDLKEAHVELKSRALELDAVNKELEAYSYTVSHDLKSPLGSIEGFTRALLEDYSDRLDATGKDYLKRVNSASLRMRQLIEALLTMARLTAGEVHDQIVDLSSMTRVIIHDLLKQEPDRQVETVIADDLKVRGDSSMLQVMLQNLLDNAWKFTGKRKQAYIELGSEIQGSEKVFYIRDNGAGFDMEFASKLFMPFHRYHSQSEFPGVGIGLATACRVINRHGGRIWANSNPDHGSVFYFTL